MITCFVLSECCCEVGSWRNAECSDSYFYEKEKKKREFTDVHVLVLAASNSDAGNDKEYYYTLPFCVSLAFYFMMIV